MRPVSGRLYPYLLRPCCNSIATSHTALIAPCCLFRPGTSTPEGAGGAGGAGANSIPSIQSNTVVLTGPASFGLEGVGIAAGAGPGGPGPGGVWPGMGNAAQVSSGGQGEGKGSGPRCEPVWRVRTCFFRVTNDEVCEVYGVLGEALSIVWVLPAAR